VIQGVHIGSDTIVGAGAVVLSHVPQSCTVVGVPARPIKVKA
jgi:serine acetyltransferase